MNIRTVTIVQQSVSKQFYFLFLRILRKHSIRTAENQYCFPLWPQSTFHWNDQIGQRASNMLGNKLLLNGQCVYCHHTWTKIHMYLIVNTGIKHYVLNCFHNEVHWMHNRANLSCLAGSFIVFFYSFFSYSAADDVTACILIKWYLYIYTDWRLHESWDSLIRIAIA